MFMKGRLWIEAYEGHLNTGKDISFYLRDQKSQQNQVRNQRQDPTHPSSEEESCLIL